MAEKKFTSQGKENTMLLDEEDLRKFEHTTLYLNNHGYVVVEIYGNQLKTLNEIFDLNIKPKYKDGTNTIKIKTSAHRFIMGVTDPKIYIDHINGNPLDNRKENLRICTQEQNSCNRGPQKNNKSGYKGVSWEKRQNKWRTQIKINEQQTHLGLFDDPVEAARAYDRAALKFFGEFAWTNFPKEIYND